MVDVATETPAERPPMQPDWPVEFARRSPPPSLRGLVIDITAYRELALGSIRQVECASLVVPLIYSFGEAFEIGLGRDPGPEDRVPSFVAGLFGGPVMISSHGRAHCLQINFTPLGAFRFFGLPMRDIANRMVPVEALDDRAVRDLGRRLEETPGWPARFVLVERFLESRLLGRRAASGAGRAYSAILRSGGTARISGLAGDLDWSRKHLTDRFREEIGLTPKAVARIARFVRAQHLALRPGRPDWAGLAAETGYADQAHLIREFRAFAGDTPGGWLASRPTV